VCWYGFTVKLAIFLPSLETGGLASLAIELGEAAKLRGIEVELITLYNSSLELKTDLKTTSLKVSPPRNGSLKPIIAFLRLSRAYFRLAKFAPHSIICLDPSSAFICLMVKLRLRMTRVAVGCYTPVGLIVRSDKFVIRNLYHFADLVVAPSSTTGKDLRQINPRIKLRIIPNPYSTASSVCLTREPQLEKKWDCLYLGRLSEEKGVRQILNIAERAPDLKFCIAGDGLEREYIENSISKREIKNIDVIGWQSPSSCLPYSRVLLVPSKSETFGIVIIESWLHGIPVVAFAGADGPRELISTMGGGGLVKEYEQIDEWILRIRDQLVKPLSDNFIVLTLQKFSAFQIIQAWF
jgi:glycosyltransferase involved in cell wall biosynthesis